MKSYGLDLKGSLLLQRTETVPTYVATDEGRLLYNTTDKTIYYADNTQWNSMAASNSVTGSGIDGQVSYWSTGNIIVGSANFLFDDSTSKFGINISTPLESVHSFSSSGYAGIFQTSTTTQVSLYNSSLTEGVKTGLEFQTDVSDGSSNIRTAVSSIKTKITNRGTDQYSTEIEFMLSKDTNSQEKVLGITSDHNILVGENVLPGTALTNGIVMENGTVPTADSVNGVQLYAFDVNSNSTLHIRQEGSVITFPSVTGTLARKEDLTIPGLADVDDTIVPIINDILKYNGTEWTTIQVIDQFDELSDVSVSGAIQGQYLIFNSGSWIPTTFTLASNNIIELLDVDSGMTPASGDFLKYDGTVWSTGSVVLDLDGLTDVVISGGLVGGEALIYNNTSGDWEATAPSYNTISELKDLSDVSNTLTPNDGEYLKYDGTATKWVATVLGTQTIASIKDITDVDSSMVPVDGDFFVFNNSVSKWSRLASSSVSTVDSISDLSDVKDVLSPGTGYALIYDGTEWTASVPLYKTTIETLDDVQTPLNPSDGETLVWVSGSTRWEALKISVSGLGDVDTTGLSDGDALKYNNTSGNWEPNTFVDLFEDLSNVDITGLVDTNLIQYNSVTGAWEPMAHNVGNIVDVDLTGLADGDILSYNTTSSNWESGAPSGGGGGLSNAYESLTDGTNTATASSNDIFKLRSSDNTIGITITNDDATHGDNADFILAAGLTNLTDVDNALAPTTDDILKYDGASWISAPVSSALLLSGYKESGVFANTPTATGTDSIALGAAAVTDKRGQLAFANNRFAADGDSQSSQFILRNITTDATQTDLFLDGVTDRLTISDDTSWFFDIKILARRTDVGGETAAYTFTGCIDRNTGTTSLVGSVIKTVVAEDSVAWDVDVEADNTNYALVVKVTGEAAKTIQWVAFIMTVETF